MQNIFRMSYFMPPIAPIKNEQGRIITPATLVPYCEVSLDQVFQLITCNENLKTLTEQVRNAEDIRIAKTSLLPFVTPCGSFSRRNGKNFLSASGLVVIDVDNLDSYDEAVEMRQALFDDPLLYPALTFISPSGLGVKAFVPYIDLGKNNEVLNITESMIWAMQYVAMAYGPESNGSASTSAKGVDTSGKDIVRSCFLSHDPGALFRIKY